MKPLVLVAAILLLFQGARIDAQPRVSKARLRARFPTIESAAHSRGHPDIAFAVDDHVLVWAAFPGIKEQQGGFLERARGVRNLESVGFTVSWVRTHTGERPAGLESRRRRDLSVGRNGTVYWKGGRMRVPVGWVDEALGIHMPESVRELRLNRLVYLPEPDGIYEAPFELPRESYMEVVARRVLSRGNRVRFRSRGDGHWEASLELAPIPGSDDRYLVAKQGQVCRIIGRLSPFANPRTWGAESRLYHTQARPNRRLDLALYNEIGPVEHLPHRTSPSHLTVVYGVELDAGYLVGFDESRGPILRPLADRQALRRRERRSGI